MSVQRANAAGFFMLCTELNFEEFEPHEIDMVHYFKQFFFYI